MAARKFLVDIDFDQNEAVRMVLQRLASSPAGTDGQLYYDTGTQLTYQYKGTPTNAWEVIGGSGTTNLSNTPSATEVTVESSSGSNTSIAGATDLLAGVLTAVDKAALDSVVINAIRWQTSNLLTGGPVGTTQWAAFLDEDNFASNSDQKVASQQSIKAYVDNAVAGGVTYKGGFDPTAGAGAGNPDLDTITSETGDMYTVTASGTYNWTTGSAVLETGDVLIAESNGVLNNVADWTIVQKNETNVVSGPASAVSNNVVFFDGTTGRLIKDNGIQLSGDNTGDEDQATETLLGIAEIATQAETDAGTDDLRIVTPLKLANYSGWTGVTKRYSTTVGDGASTSFVITHSLGNRFVQVQLFETLTPWRQVECQVDLTSSTQCTLGFNDIVASNEYTVVVIG